MTRLSNESKTSHAVATNLSELELKKILIDKIERNKSIHRSNEQNNLYNALVEAYKSDKLILETYGETVLLKTAPKERTTKITGKSTNGSKSQHKSAGESAHTEEPIHTDKDLKEPTHQEFDIGATKEQSDEKTSQHPNCRTYATSVTKTKAADYGHIKWIEDLITVRRDDDNLYTFKEGYFKWLRLQDIEDMLILLVQGKLTNLNVEDRLAFDVSLRMFTRSIVIQRRVKDLQLGVESYQKKLNITKPDTYRSDLKSRDSYTAYSNTRGFIYQNKDKKNKLMHIDELHKYSDGTLDDV
ncbi:hypothetical protein Tco_1089888 [Tanacetum coccineum]|uniref:Uncharacterized protein n=1 Tax=Tanacetum coccineum TaxID=301880 RepID=A0ABQ5I2S6_9ASTR